MTIGILPAAGKATRIHGLPKYLLPVPGGYLLERMAARMTAPCVIGANPDNAALIESCKPPNSTVYTVNSRSMPETILAAREYAGDDNVLVGMPDTYWTDEDVFASLKMRTINFGMMCAVALFAVTPIQATRLGVCPITNVGGYPFIASVIDKNPHVSTEYRIYAWGALAWRAEFWQYIQPDDAHMGIALQRALDDDVPIMAYLADGDYYDNGTPDDYFRCIRELTEVNHATR